MGKRIDPEAKAEQVLAELRAAIREAHECLAGIKEFKRDFDNAVTKEWKEVLDQELTTLRQGVSSVEEELHNKYSRMDDQLLNSIVLRLAKPMMVALLESIKVPIGDMIEQAVRDKTGLPFRITVGELSKVKKLS